MKNKLLLIVFLFLFSFSGYSLDAVEFYTGYLHSRLKNDELYSIVPFTISLNFDAANALKTIGVKNYYGKVDFLLEPFVNLVVGDYNDYEVGSNFLIKYTYPLSEKIKPYFKMGLGIVYMGADVEQQETYVNFLPQCGLGLYYFIRKDVAVSCECHYRHLSNAGISSPNNGIDSVGMLLGISKFFN